MHSPQCNTARDKEVSSAEGAAGGEFADEAGKIAGGERRAMREAEESRQIGGQRRGGRERLLLEHIQKRRRDPTTPERLGAS